MIAWTFLGLLAVATAAPQLQTFQTINPTALPIRTQTINTPLRSQAYNIQQVPIQYQQVPLQVQQIPVQYSTVPVQTIQQRISSTPVSVLRQQQVEPIQQVVSPLVRSQVVPNYINTQSLVSNQQVVQPVLRTQQVAQPVLRTQVAQPVLRTQQVIQPALRSQIAYQPQQKYYNDGGFAILRQVQDVHADGSYQYAYETENGISAAEEGQLINQGTDAEAQVVRGSYSYVDPEGRTITVNYVADENGFRAEGDHIPKIPEAIAKSLEYLRSLPARPEDQQ